MSEQEKFEAQGRAHAALRLAKSNLATLAVSLQAYSQELARLSGELQRLLADPVSHQSELETLRRQLRELATDRALLQLAEIFEEAEKVRSLTEQIDQF